MQVIRKSKAIDAWALKLAQIVVKSAPKVTKKSKPKGK